MMVVQYREQQGALLGSGSNLDPSSSALCRYINYRAPTVLQTVSKTALTVAPMTVLQCIPVSLP